jgi:TolA-binding protein
LKPASQASAVSAARAAPAESASGSEDALAGEAKLLNQAHVAMAADPQQALAIAGEHAKRYPRGQLAAERELILVQALVKLGRVREAEARGRALRKNTPSSIYGERLDTILKGK